MHGWRGMMMHDMMHRNPQERCEERLAWRAAMRAYTESKLDLTPEQRPLWDKVQSIAQSEQQKERQTERPPAEGSQMVKNDAPVLRPTPSGPMRRTPDRYAAATKLGKEHDSADAKIEAARKAQETFKSRQGKSHDHERDHER